MNAQSAENARQARQRIRRVHELRDAGFEWPTIARQTGYSNGNVASNAYARYVRRYGPPPWPGFQEEQGR